MKINIPNYVRNVLDALEKAGFEAYIVGGCVRDYLLDKTPHDFDVCTNAKPEQMMEVFSNFNVIETGLKHGTLTVISDHEPVEVTTYRSDGEYADHRRPKQVKFENTLDKDLKRRDFTVNALCYSEKKGIIDLFGGEDDLKNGVIRAVGEAERRFDEDALRILRGLRFASVLDFEIEEKTAEAMFKQAELLSLISAERIFIELKKLLCGKNAGDILLKYRDIFAVIIPELVPAFDFPQICPHHCFDVYTHICRSVDNIPNEESLRLTMLFHDIEKPKMATTDENGVMHFKLHPVESEKTARMILRRLKCDNKTRSLVCDLIYEHDNRLENAKKNTVKRFIAKYGEDFFEKYLLVRRADTLAQSDYLRAQKLEGLEKLKALGAQIIEENSCLKISDLAVNGKDIIAMGYKGRQIGEALELALNAVIDEQTENDKTKLLQFIKGTLK